jgi:L-aminoadipate-semialdehyde dehydrogenase
VTNTDDFLIRLIKGCIQLGSIPEIYNTVNMVPVDHVARLVTATAFYSQSDFDHLDVIHVTGHPRSRFIEMLSSLAEYGYDVSTTDYIPWRIALERYTILDAKDNALYPLLHFVLDNLPQSTKAPELDDRNARAVLKSDSQWTGIDLSAGKGVSYGEMGLYLGYLVGIGFLERPRGTDKQQLPDVKISSSVREMLTRVGGRGSKT